MSKSFEEVKSELSPDEKILWEQKKISNGLSDLKSTMFTLIFISGSSTFVILLYFLTSTIDFSDIWIPFLSFVFLFVFLISSIPLYMFLAEIIKYWKISKKLNVRIRDLKKYEEFTILTNKRWIQKSLSLIEYDYVEYSNDLILFQKDVIFVNLRDINVIHTYSIRKKKKESFYIHSYMLWGTDEEPLPQITVEKADFLILTETLLNLFNITKEEHDILFYGDRVIFVKKKNY